LLLLVLLLLVLLLVVLLLVLLLVLLEFPPNPSSSPAFCRWRFRFSRRVRNHPCTSSTAAYSYI
jgi:hypothetical protein